MAQVFLPEVTNEDPFPRAPPPSPEMQPCSHNHVFEIPASKFDGMGLDLRRDTFPLDEDDESPLNTHHYHLDPPKPPGGREEDHQNPQHRSRGLFGTRLIDDDEDEWLPGSPQKRVCCSPSTLPRDHMITVHPSSSAHSSLVSSGIGSFQHDVIPEEEGGVVTGDGGVTGFGGYSGTRPHSNSPPHFGTGMQHHHHSPFTGHRSGILSLQPHPPPALPLPTGSASPSSDHTLLSRSYDLHHMHPHLPLSFETTQLPEVRPTRSRTLDSSTPSPHDLPPRTRSHTLDSEGGLGLGAGLGLGVGLGLGQDDASGHVDGGNGGGRRRKISIKRKNPEDTDGEDSSLQFSFEYSFSSTGSSAEPDWVMVDCKVEPSRPMEKKACCVSDPASIPTYHPAGATSSLLNPPTTLGGVAFPSSFDGQVVGSAGQSGGLFSLGPSPLQGSSGGGGSVTTTTSVSPFSLTPSLATGFAEQRGVGMVGERVDTPIIQPPSLDSVTMMDCEGKMESLDLMECEANMIAPPDVQRGVASSYTEQSTLYQPMVTVEQVTSDSNGPIMRPHPPRPGDEPHPLLPPLRHSCMEPLHRQVGGASGSGFAAEYELDYYSGLNLSKSL